MDYKFNFTISIYTYCLFVGISYFLGMCIELNINLFSYLDINDIIKVSFYALIPTVGSLIFWSIFAAAGSKTKEEESKEHKLERIVNTIFFMIFFVIGLIFLLSCIYESYLGDGILKLKGIFPIITLITYIYLSIKKPLFATYSLKIRTALNYIICFAPLFAFWHGISDGKNALNHDAKGYYVEGNAYCLSSDKEKFRYIGIFGGKIFSSSSKDNSICIMKSEDFKLVIYNN
jgi:hypothetical protein